MRCSVLHRRIIIENKVNVVNGMVTGIFLGSPMQDATPDKPEDNAPFAIERNTVSRLSNYEAALEKQPTTGGADSQAIVNAILDGSITELTTNVTTTRASAFISCNNLTKVCFTDATSIGGNTFNGCSSLHTVDAPKVVNIGIQAFQNCTNLTSVILRSESICSLKNMTVFSGSGLNGGKGYVYVPRALIDSYNSDSVWKQTVAGRIRALEDYTVDGTITGELDETKI